MSINLILFIMITLCNHTFKDITHVKRAFELLQRRGKERPQSISSHELQLGRTMFQYLKQYSGQ